MEEARQHPAVIHGPIIVLLFIALAGSGMFGFWFVRGLRTGITRIPIQLIGFEEFDRAEAPALFNLAMFVNAVGAVGLLVVAGLASIHPAMFGFAAS